MGSPTSRTLELFRKSGYLAEVVEKWNPHSKTRKDLLGCIDIVAVANDETHIPQIVGVQATSASNVSARKKKSVEQPGFFPWIRAGGRFYVIGWKKVKNRWQPTIWLAVHDYTWKKDVAVDEVNWLQENSV